MLSTVFAKLAVFYVTRISVPSFLRCAEPSTHVATISTLMSFPMSAYKAEAAAPAERAGGGGVSPSFDKG